MCKNLAKNIEEKSREIDDKLKKIRSSKRGL
jgi:hypothetical protein